MELSSHHPTRDGGGDMLWLLLKSSATALISWHGQWVGQYHDIGTVS